MISTSGLLRTGGIGRGLTGAPAVRCAARAAALVALLGLAGGLGGCASSDPEPGAESMRHAGVAPGEASSAVAGAVVGAVSWVPAAKPVFVTIGRDTSHAVAPHDGADLVVIEQRIPAGRGRAASRLTWLVPVRSGAGAGEEFMVGGTGREAWLLERVPGGRAHATPAHGRVRVLGADASSMRVSLSVAASVDGEPAGEFEPEAVWVSGEFDAPRRVVWSPQHRGAGNARDAAAISIDQVERMSAEWDASATSPAPLMPTELSAPSEPDPAGAIDAPAELPGGG